MNVQQVISNVQSNSAVVFAGVVADVSNGFVRLVDPAAKKAVTFTHRSDEFQEGDVLPITGVQIYWGSLMEGAAEKFGVKKEDVASWQHAIVYGPGIPRDLVVKKKVKTILDEPDPVPAAGVRGPTPGQASMTGMMGVTGCSGPIAAGGTPQQSAAPASRLKAITSAFVGSKWKCLSDGATLVINSCYVDPKGLIRCAVSSQGRVRNRKDFALWTILSDYIEVP